MQIYPATTKSDAGYTLLELLVVVAIISLLIGLIPTGYSVFYTKYQVYNFVDRLALVARHQRKAAQEKQEIQSIEYITEAATLVFSQGELLVPDNVNIQFVPSENWAPTQENHLEFYPSGASSGGEFLVSSGTMESQVIIDWVSCSVKINR